jgi:predicted TIM-barrel fold metal-dependent hydrolase
MYVMPNGEEIFVIDGHTHLWDASPANHKNIHGKEFIDCFYDYHRNLSPADYLWPKEKFEKYPLETLVQDLFVDGYDDMAILQPTYLKDFYTAGFNTTEQNAAAKRAYPDRFILNGAFDPRDEDRGLEYLEELVEKFKIRGVKLYTAEWRGQSKGYKLTDKWAIRYLEKCQELGVKNIHVHKGPTILPLNMDAFDVHDVDGAATSFPDLNFIVEHVGLPRLDDFGFFAHIISELLFWLSADRLLFGSDYGIWHPKWLIEKFTAFELPDEVQKETGVNLTLDAKKKILGENAARLYGIDVPAQKARLKQQRIASAVQSV